jgi:hypothetical protein
MSMSVRLSSFADLLAPIRQKAFFDQYWECQPLHIRRSDADHYAPLLTTWPRPNIDTGGESSGSAVISVAACVRQAESARESGFGEMSAREQMTNPEFTTSVIIHVTACKVASQSE